MHKIFLIFTLLVISLYTGEIEERHSIKEKVKFLFEQDKYEEITKLANYYLKTEARTSGGRWKLRFLYSGTYRLVDSHVKDANYWSEKEKKFLAWIERQPNEATPHIAYAQFLIGKGWMYRGNSYAYKIPKEKWKLFKNEIYKATKYLIKHKEIASKNPHWYTVMLNLAKLNSSSIIVFNTLLNEALKQYPNYYSIYEFALYYMHPKWHNFSQIEIEKVAQKILHLTNDRDGAYARFYWMAKDIMHRDIRVSDFNINWDLMTKSMERLISKYPTQYNINGMAYLSCLLNNQEISLKYINKIIGNPMLNIWKNIGAFNQCKMKKYEPITVKTIKPNELLEYIESYKGLTPLFIYFSSYKREDILKDIEIVEKISKKFSGKVNFLSVNFYPYLLKDYPFIAKKYYLKKLPSSLMIDNKKIILRIDNFTSGDQYLTGILEISITNILQEMRYDNFLKFFKETINDENSYINTEENIRANVEAYLEAKGNAKAYAVVSDMQKDIWASGRALYADSQNQAKKNALLDCEQGKKKFNISKKCKLFMVGNKYVFDKNDTFFVKKKPLIHTKDINLKRYKFHSPISLKRIREKYNASKGYKAWALMEYTDFSISHTLGEGYATQEEANLATFNKCEKHRIESHISNACTLYMAGEKSVYTQNLNKDKLVNRMDEKMKMMKVFRMPSKKITIDNKGTPFGILETIDFEININNYVIEANMVKGILKGKDLKNYTKSYLPEMSLCIGEDITKRWKIETCSEPYPINEYMTRNKEITLKAHKFIIPRSVIGKDLDKKWFIIKIVSQGKRRGYIYAHHRKDTLDKFLDN